MCNSRRETVSPKLVEDTKRGVFLNEANQRLRPIENEQPNRWARCQKEKNLVLSKASTNPNCICHSWCHRQAGEAGTEVNFLCGELAADIAYN